MRTANAVLRLRKMNSNAVGNLGSRMIHAVPRLRMTNAGPRLRKRIFNAVTMFGLTLIIAGPRLVMVMANTVPRLKRENGQCEWPTRCRD